MLDAGVVFVGFWTLRGSVDTQTREWLKQLKNKKIFLFGTAGFGKSDDYFDQIIKTSIQDLDPSNALIGTFMCQGKMPESVKERYEKIIKEHGDEQAQMMLENFQEAITHPDDQDVHRLQMEVAKCLMDI